MAQQRQEPPDPREFTQALQKAGIALSGAIDHVGSAGELGGMVLDVPATGLFGKRNDGCNLNRGCTVNESCSG
jgi:hypothetical protein